MALKLQKITPNLSVGVNFGFFQLSAGASAELGRVAEAEFASRVGPSPINMKRDLSLLSNMLQGLDLDSTMNAVKEVEHILQETNFKVGIITGVGTIRETEVGFGPLGSTGAIIVSLLLCIRHAIGDNSTVRCLKQFLMKLAENQGLAPIDGAWLEKYIRSLAECVALAGTFQKLESAEAAYDEKYNVGRGWNYGYRGVIEKVVGVLLDMLAMPVVDADARTVWWTRSRKVHKLAYLLSYMGWNVQIGPESDLLPSKSEPNLVVNFTSAVNVQGQLIEDQLNPAGDTAPARMQALLEEEQGAGFLVPDPREGLVHVVRGVLQEETTRGRAVEESWYLGYHIGEKCKAEVVFGDKECSYRFGASTLVTQSSGYPGGVEDILYLLDKSVTNYASNLHHILGGSREEYERLGRFIDSVLKYSNSTIEFTNDRHHNLLKMVLAFFLGLVYGKLEALLVATGLGDADGSSSSTKLEFRVGWVDHMVRFLYDVQPLMWELSIPNLRPPNMHAVFKFIGICCSGNSLYFGKRERLDDIVGFWTGTSLVMLVAALTPGINPTLGAKLVNYPVWPLNLSTIDGVNIQSSGWSVGNGRMRDVDPQAQAPIPFPALESPKQDLNIYLSPNYVEGNAQVIHSLMCDGDLVFAAPVMGALVNLHGKIVECSCDATPERTEVCVRGLPISVEEFKNGFRICLSNNVSTGFVGKCRVPFIYGVVMARSNIPWRFAASCIYHDLVAVIAESCLSCAREATLNGQTTEYII